MAEQERDPRGLSLAQVAASVAAAFFGVQKEAHLRRDVSRGRPHQFIILGLAGVVLFVLLVLGVVRLVMWTAGA